MNLVLNIISVLSTFIIIEGIIYFTLNSTFGRLNVLKNFAFKDIVFLVFGVILILCFFDFYLPH